MQLILLSEPVWIKICGEIDEISRKVLITGVIGYDSIRKHLHIKEKKAAAAEISSITANIDALKADLKTKKAELKSIDKEIARIEAKKVKAETKAAESAKKAEAEDVLKKLLASGVSADEILAKLK